MACNGCKGSGWVVGFRQPTGAEILLRERAGERPPKSLEEVYTEPARCPFCVIAGRDIPSLTDETQIVAVANQAWINYAARCPPVP